MFSQNQQTGQNAERWVYEQLVKRGYQPQAPADFFAAAYDMRVKNLCIEVKLANATWRKSRQTDKPKWYRRWQWNIHPSSKKLNCEWLLILIADSFKERYVYILPGSAIGDRSQIQITSHPDQYRGWLAQWRDRWDVIDYLSQEAYKDNGPLFHQWKVEEEGEIDNPSDVAKLRRFLSDRQTA